LVSFNFVFISNNAILDVLQIFYDLMRLIRDKKMEAAGKPSKQNATSGGSGKRRKKKCTVL
jgi:hypothetical protein